MAAVAAGPTAAHAADLMVRYDQSQLIRLPRPASEVIIGNPSIADVAIQGGNLLVVTGKSFGVTNIVVMDKAGAILTEHTVQVAGPVDQTVVVYRGVNRETYSCMPDCAPRITLGDDTKFFTDALAQVAARNSQSLAAGAGAH